MIEQRILGKSGIAISPMGLGCWAIGGPWSWSTGVACGWGQVDDAASIRAIHAALEMGITFFDTAANYGAGHSERMLGQALAGRRDQAVIATKFGHLVDEASKVVDDNDDLILQNVRQDCENSLRRLNTDYIDLYQLHAGEYDPEKAPALRDELEALVSEGKIRAYGWSTDDVDRAHLFASGDNCASVQHRLHVRHDMPEMLAMCDEYDLASINKSPLGSGLLTGKYNRDSQLPPDDWRSRADFTEDHYRPLFEQLPLLREVLTSGGRTMAQGALGWVWARHGRTIPIPGFRNEQQARENAGAMQFGALTDDQLRQIDEILGRDSVQV